MIPLFPLPFLAEVAATAAPHTSPPDQMLSGNWLLYAFGIVVSICVGAWLRISGKKAGIQEATNNVTIQPPFPDVSVRKLRDPVSIETHNALRERVDKVEREQREMRNQHHADQEELKNALHGQFKDLLESGHEREQRLGEKIAEGDEKLGNKIESIAVEWHRRMDLQFGPKPRSPRA